MGYEGDLLIFGGGIGWIIHWKAEQRKANGEATKTEADAMQSVQDVYQETILDQRTFINELRADRDHLRQDRDEMRRENNELRRRQDEMENEMQQLKRDVERNGRMVQAVRSLICGRINCAERTKVDLGVEETREAQSNTKATETKGYTKKQEKKDGTPTT